MRAMVRPTVPMLGGAAVVLAALLVGCTGTHPGAPGPTAPPATAVMTTTPTPSPAPAPTPAPPANPAPALVPGGTAEQNLAYFDRVNKATIAANPSAGGRAFVDALVAAGFAKADMQLTPDTTTIGLKASSIQFSVQFGATCLIGQYGADAGGYTSTTSATLATGGCLIGQTRPIDW